MSTTRNELARLMRAVIAPRPILLERGILKRVLAHFETRKHTWETRGMDGSFRIGQYYEFGCYNGDSLVDVWNALRIRYGRRLPDYWRMVAFDSFEGLPATGKVEDLHPIAGAGSYKSDGMARVAQRLAAAGCGADRLRLVKGFYEESLTEGLRDELLAQGMHPSLVNIDCDYYSSTKTVLEWIEPLLLDGTVVYFDDILFYNGNPHKGELKAIDEFNTARTESGLAPAPWFDPAGRCYLYWRNEEVTPHAFEFKEYVTG